MLEMTPAGIEPATYRLGGDRSILLSYGARLIAFSIKVSKNRVND